MPESPMKLRHCQQCGTPHFGDSCPVCCPGEVEKSRSLHNILVGALGIGLLALFPLGFGFCSGMIFDPKPSPPSPPSGSAITLRPDQHDFLTTLETQGFLTIDRPSRTAHVDPLLWFKMDAQNKADFAAVVAIECAIHNHATVVKVELFDKQSARKLATFSGSAGLVVY